MVNLEHRAAYARFLVKFAVALLALAPSLAVVFGLVDLPPVAANLGKLLSLGLGSTLLLAAPLAADRLRAMSADIGLSQSQFDEIAANYASVGRQFPSGPCS